jgi:predicted porin
MNAIKKKLMSAVVIGATLALASSAALAQSNVTIYGNLSLSVTKATDKSVAIDETGFGSNLGFKGTEDLGGGLAAYFDFRANFKADTGASATPGILFDEKSFVGLKGAFGSVQLGRFANAFDDISFKAFGDTVASEHSISTTFSKNANTIGYYSPSFGGLTFSATTALKESGLNGFTQNVSSAKAKYVNGPLSAGIGYENNGNGSTAGKYNTVIAGGAYDFGVVKVNGDYAKASSTNESNLRVGVSVPVGSGAFKAAYTKAKNSPTFFDNQIGIGYWYSLSKRTMVFTDANRSKFSVGGSKNAFDVGITHSF